MGGELPYPLTPTPRTGTARALGGKGGEGRGKRERGTWAGIDLVLLAEQF